MHKKHNTALPILELLTFVNFYPGLQRQAGRQALTFGFRSKTIVCFGLLAPNLLYG